MGCPYEGQVDAGRVGEIAHQLDQMGCYEISLGDTIGTGTPNMVTTLIGTLMEKLPFPGLPFIFMIPTARRCQISMLPY